MAKTMNIKLRPFSKADFQDLLSWIHTPDELILWSADTFTFPLTEAQLEHHFQKAQGPNPRVMYTALDNETGERIGHIELTRIDQEKGKASIAYVLIDPGKRGSGYGTAMLQKIMQHCFDQMKLRRLDLFVFEINAIAIQCYQKLGFEIEDVVNDRIKLNGEFKVLYLMELDQDRWIALKLRDDSKK